MLWDTKDFQRFQTAVKNAELAMKKHKKGKVSVELVDLAEILTFCESAKEDFEKIHILRIKLSDVHNFIENKMSV